MKAHLIDSPIPLKEGQDYSALCGIAVPSVRFVFFWDEVEAGFAQITVFGTCLKCRQQKYMASESKRYVYGIVNGQEAKIEAAGD